MKWILLAGVALNLAGSVQLLLPALAAALSATDETEPVQLQFRLFTGGTAAVFAAFYLYLFLNPKYVDPFLIFGATLKTWAFLLSLILYRRKRMPTETFAGFGLSNAAAGTLFWIYIGTEMA